jgi:3-hydroxyacyl-[acyl-carrier-protein] dehydratase
MSTPEFSPDGISKARAIDTEWAAPQFAICNAQFAICNSLSEAITMTNRDDSAEAVSPSSALDLSAIHQQIPHRPPFLWVDEVVSIDDARIHARKRIDADLDVFRGHYPAFPVLPGVLQIEAAFQAGALLIARISPPVPDSVPVVTRLNNVQFRQLVRPGDVLDIEVELTERLGNAFFLKGKTLVGGKTTVRLEFACALTAASAT